MNWNNKKTIIAIVILMVFIIAISIYDSLKGSNDVKKEDNVKITDKKTTILDEDNKSFKKFNDAWSMSDEELKEKESEIADKAQKIKENRIRTFKNVYTAFLNGQAQPIDEYVDEDFEKKLIKESEQNKKNKITIKITDIVLKDVKGNPEMLEYYTEEKIEIITDGKKELKKIQYKYIYDNLGGYFKSMELIKEEVINAKK